MFRKSWAVLALCTAFSAACSRGQPGEAADAAAAVVFRYANSGHTVQVKAGERFDVVLSTRNTPDGRSDFWAGSAKIEGDAVDWLGKEVTGPGEDREGPHVHTFRFSGKQPGTSRLVIGNYHRPPYELTVQVR